MLHMTFVFFLNSNLPRASQFECIYTAFLQNIAQPMNQCAFIHVLTLRQKKINYSILRLFLAKTDEAGKKFFFFFFLTMKQARELFFNYMNP